MHLCSWSQTIWVCKKLVQHAAPSHACCRCVWCTPRAVTQETNSYIPAQEDREGLSRSQKKVKRSKIKQRWSDMKSSSWLGSWTWHFDPCSTLNLQDQQWQHEPAAIPSFSFGWGFDLIITLQPNTVNHPVLQSNIWHVLTTWWSHWNIKELEEPDLHPCTEQKQS